MNLIHEFTFTGFLKPPVPVGQGQIGTRMYYEVAEGAITGERLLGGGEARLLPGGVEYRVWRHGPWVGDRRVVSAQEICAFQ